MGMKAMVIDDSRTARTMARRLLVELGYEVTEAMSAEAALDVLENDPLPDLLLVDWHMPGATGIDLVRTVRSDRRLMDLPVLMVTQECSVKSVTEALDAGASEYIMKPFDVVGLREKLTMLEAAR
jgi:two-component system chemotaxis response regulator CheY